MLLSENYIYKLVKRGVKPIDGVSVKPPSLFLKYDRTINAPAMKGLCYNALLIATSTAVVICYLISSCFGIVCAVS